MSVRVLAALALCLSLAACATPSDDAGNDAATPTSQQGTTTTSPEPSVSYDSPPDAIAAYLSERDLEYAGSCSETDLQADAGKYCSEVVEDRGTALVAKIGGTFSEYDTYLLIRRNDTGWVVVRTAGIPYPEDDGTLPF